MWWNLPDWDYTSRDIRARWDRLGQGLHLDARVASGYPSQFLGSRASLTNIVLISDWPCGKVPLLFHYCNLCCPTKAIELLLYFTNLVITQLQLFHLCMKSCVLGTHLFLICWFCSSFTWESPRSIEISYKDFSRIQSNHNYIRGRPCNEITGFMCGCAGTVVFVYEHSLLCNKSMCFHTKTFLYKHR